jgi:hypothetical protein
MQKVYKDAKNHLKSISLNSKFKLTDSALFYKSMLCMFSSTLLFWLYVWIYFEMKRDWVLKGKMWFMKMIILYEIMDECMQRATIKWGLCTEHPDVKKGETKLTNSLTIKWSHTLNTLKL